MNIAPFSPSQNLPVTRIVDELMEMKTSQETEDYRYFDPKQLRVVDGSQIPRNRTPFQEAIVFMVGGGNYIEYQNLVDYTKVCLINPFASLLKKDHRRLRLSCVCVCARARVFILMVSHISRMRNLVKLRYGLYCIFISLLATNSSAVN
jgi:hypothetical protein